MLTQIVSSVHVVIETYISAMASPANSSATLAALNSTGLLKKNGDSGKKFIKPIELGLDIEHDVIRLESINTKFGRAISCLLQDSSVILPRRFATSLTDESIAELNTKNLVVIYKGSCATKHKPTALIEFKEKKSGSQQQQ